MDLPPSGHKACELLVISTKDFDLTIKGIPRNKIVETFELHQDESGEPVRANLTITPTCEIVQVYDPHSLKGLSDYNGGGIYPCFFERTNYELVIEKKDACEHELTVEHLNKKIRDAITPTGKAGHILSGILNFNEEVGFSHFKIMGGNQCLLSFEIEVFPSKLDYEKDFRRLLQEVNEEVYNLAFDFLMKTSFSASIKSEDKPSQAEFYYILNYIFKKMLLALNHVMTNPHHKIVQVNRIVPPEKIKKADGKTVAWLVPRAHLFQKSTSGIRVDGNNYIPRKVQDSKKELTFDTYENRFIKWMLTQLGQKLKHFQEKYQEVYVNSSDTKVIDRVMLMRKQLNKYRNTTFLKEVGNLGSLQNTSLVMQMAPGYRDVYKYFLMTLKGLHINSDLFNLSIKNLAELYEYWCFLKINSLLRHKYQLERNDIVEVDRKGITVNLVKGKESLLRYRDPRNNEQFTVIYNRCFNRLPTLSQKPDNILKFEKTGSDVNYQYIFDAKYRLTVDKEYINAFGQIGPPVDTINTMHRYRDAIITEDNKDNQYNQYKRNIFGAFVLFPHNDEEAYAGRKEGPPCKFYNSIEEISIGALPFLPSQTTLMEEFLDDLLLESPHTASERAIIQEGAGEYTPDKDSKKNVLIGPLRRKEQLKFSLAKNIYYTYLDKVQSFLGSLEYVAIYQSKEKFKNEEDQGIFYYGKINDYKITKRKSIREIPSNPDRGDNMIVQFYIDSWHKKDPPIIPGGYGPSRPQRTNWQLFKEARIYPELHLDILEVRLWRELKRFGECVSIKFPNQSIDNIDRMELIEFPGLIIKRINSNNFKACVNENKFTYDFDTLQRKPRKILKEIINLWKKH